MPPTCLRPRMSLRQLAAAPSGAALRRSLARPVAVRRSQRRLERGPASGRVASRARSRPFRAGVPAPDGAPLVSMRSFAELVALAAEKRDIQTQGRAGARRAAGAFRAGRAGIFARPRRFGGACRRNLTRKLQDWTGQRWMVALSSAPGAPTLDGTGRGAGKREADRRAGASAGARGARTVSRRGDRRGARRRDAQAEPAASRSTTARKFAATTLPMRRIEEEDF